MCHMPNACDLAGLSHARLAVAYNVTLVTLKVIVNALSQTLDVTSVIYWLYTSNTLYYPVTIKVIILHNALPPTLSAKQ